MFDNWESAYTETAVKDPDNIDPTIWEGFKKKAAAKRAELSGSNGLAAANAESDAEAEGDSKSPRLQLAQRKRDLEERIAGFMGVGEDVNLLGEAERQELATLRSTVSPQDEADLDALDEVANDDREHAVVDGRFIASPSLALDREKYRAAVGAAQLTPRQKVDALMEGVGLREQVGARIRGEIDAADLALDDMRYAGFGPKIGGFDDFRAFEADLKEGNPDATDADVMEAWQKQHGSWYSNLGTQIKIGGVRTGADLVGTYYGLKRLAGYKDPETEARAAAAGELQQQLAAGSEGIGGATLASEATSMVLTSMATAPAGVLGRGLMAAGRAGVALGARTAAAATAGRVGATVLSRAAAAKLGGEATKRVLAKQLALQAAGGTGASVLASAMQSAGGAFNQYYDEFVKDELGSLTEEQRNNAGEVEAARQRARDAARSRALVSGAITAAVVGFASRFGATGAQKLSKPNVAKLDDAAVRSAKEGFAVFIGKSLSKEALGEAGEEVGESLANDIYDKITSDPTKPVAEIVENALKSAAAGGLLGGAMAVPFSTMEFIEARRKAKQDPAIATQVDAAERLDNNGAPESAAVLREKIKPEVEARTQEELDAARRKAEEDAAASLEPTPAYEAATVVARRTREELDALPPDDPQREDLQRRLDEVNAAIKERGADAMVPTTPPEAAATTPAAAATPPAAPAESPEIAAAPPAAPAPTKEMFDALTVGETYTSPDGAVWTRRENQFGEPVMVSKSEGAQVRLPTADFVTLLRRSAPTTELPAAEVKAARPRGAKPAAGNEAEVAAANATLTYQQEQLSAATTDEERARIQTQISTVTSRLAELGAPVPQPTPTQTNDTQAKEPQASGVSPVEGQPAGRVPEAEAPARAPSRARQGKADSGKALTRDQKKAIKEQKAKEAAALADALLERLEPPTAAPQPKAKAKAKAAPKPKAPAAPKTRAQEVDEAVAQITAGVMATGSIPDTRTISSKIRSLTGKGISNAQNRTLVAIQNSMRKAWAAKHPPESGKPDEFYTGSKAGASLKPIGSKSDSDVAELGGRIPVKRTPGGLVGFFTNVPSDVAKQLNAGLKVTVPAELRGQIAPGIEIDGEGNVLSVYDAALGATIRGSEQWTAAYQVSPERQAKADEQLKPGREILAQEGVTLDSLYKGVSKAADDLARASANPSTSSKKLAEAIASRDAALEAYSKAWNAAHPRTPFAASEAFLAKHAPTAAAGEGPVLTAYLSLDRSSEAGSVVSAMVAKAVNRTRLAGKGVEVEVEAAVVNTAMSGVRNLLYQKPGTSVEVALNALPGLQLLVRDAVNDFVQADIAYGANGVTSFDEMTAGDRSDAELSGAEAALVEPPSEMEDDAAAELTPEEESELKDALAAYNGGNPDPMSFAVLSKHPAQARKALGLARENHQFTVGLEGEIVLEHGKPLSLAERAALKEAVRDLDPYGDSNFVGRLLTRPNFGRFLLQLATMGRDVLRGVKTDIGGRPKYTSRDISNMGLEQILRAVGGASSEAMSRIVAEAKSNIDALSATGSFDTEEFRTALTMMFRGKTPVAAPSGSVASRQEARRQAREEQAAVQAVVAENLPAVLNTAEAELTRLNEAVATAQGLIAGAGADKARKAELTAQLTLLKESQARQAESVAELRKMAADAAASVKAAPAPTAAALDVARKKYDEATKVAKAKAEARRQSRTNKSPTRAVNSGVKPGPRTPKSTASKKQVATFTSELAKIGVNGTADRAQLATVVAGMATRESLVSGHQKALARMLMDNPSLLEGIDSVEVVNNPDLADDVTVGGGVLTLNLAAMTPTADGSARGPEALLRGLVTHAVTKLTTPGATLTATQSTALSNLDALRQEVVRIEADTRAPGLEQRHTDALRDTPSFVRAVLTSPQFAEMILGYKLKKDGLPTLKSAWGRFWAAVGELLTGKAVKAGSALHAALVEAGNLMVTSPSMGKRFMDAVKAILHNPQAALPTARMAPTAAEAAHIDAVQGAVEAANSPASVATVGDRLLGSTSPDNDPEVLSEADGLLMLDDSMLGSSYPDPKLLARDLGEGTAQPPTAGRVRVVLKATPPAPAGSDVLTKQQVFAGLGDAVRAVDLLDKVSRGVLTAEEAGAAVTPSAVASVLGQITARKEQIKNYPASNRDEWVALLEDMEAFLQLEVGAVAPEAVTSIDPDTLADDADIPVATPAEEDVDENIPYAEAAPEEGTIDLAPFLASAASRTGRAVKLIDGGPKDRPVIVKSDRTDKTIYVNRAAIVETLKDLRDRGFTQEEATRYLNALVDREAATLTILHRFSNGELVATARSLTREQRLKVLHRVHGLKPGDPKFDEINRLLVGNSPDTTAMQVQLGCDYYRMMRQVSETGHTTEDVLDMLGTSPNVAARAVAFLRATARQFLSWWSSYGDVGASKAILNIEEFLLAAGVTPDPVTGSASIPPRPDNLEVPAMVGRATGRTPEQVRSDLDEAALIRRAMNAAAGDTELNTQLSEDGVAAFVNELGLADGDPRSVAAALAKIGSMEGVDPATKAAAAYLAKHPDLLALRGLSFCVGASGGDNKLTRPSGLYDPNSHAIALNLSYLRPEFRGTMQQAPTRALLIETLIHEASHAVTSVAYNNYLQGKAAPEVAAAFKDLDTLRAAVIAHAKGSPAEAEFAYRLSDSEEFIAGVMSDTKFATWLASLPPSVAGAVPSTPGRGSLIKQILSRIYAALFPDLDRDSAFSKSLDRIFDISARPQVVVQPASAVTAVYGRFPSAVDPDFNTRQQDQEAAMLDGVPRAEDTATPPDTTGDLVEDMAGQLTETAPATEPSVNETVTAQPEIESAIESSLTSEEKAAAAAELDEPSWTAAAVVKFKQVLADWTLGARKVSAALEAIFRKVISTGRSTVLTGAILFGSANVTSGPEALTQLAPEKVAVSQVAKEIRALSPTLQAPLGRAVGAEMFPMDTPADFTPATDQKMGLPEGFAMPKEARSFPPQVQSPLGGRAAGAGALPAIPAQELTPATTSSKMGLPEGFAMPKVPATADFGGRAAPSDVVVTANWIVSSGDNKGKPFVVADKTNGLMFLFDKTGKATLKTPALFGKEIGDALPPKRDPGDRVNRTPAGRFDATLDKGVDYYGDTVDFYSTEETTLAIHKLYLANPAEKRTQRLASKSPADNRISHGCINVDESVFNKHVAPAFAEGGGVVYVLPETKRGRKLFAPLAPAKVKFSMPSSATGPVKTTQALKNSLPAMPDQIADYIKGSTYTSGNNAKDLDAVQAAIGARLAAATEASEFGAIEGSLGAMGFTDVQHALARVVVGAALNKRIADLNAALAKTPSAAGLAMLRDYVGQAKVVWSKVVDTLSKSGQMLNVGAIARDLLNPGHASATYRDGIADRAKSKLPADLSDVFAELERGAMEAAKTAVRKSPLIKKIVAATARTSGADPAAVQMMFDFMEELRAVDDRSIPEQMSEWVSNKMLAMLDRRIKDKVKAAAKASGESEDTFFEAYSDEVKRLVEARINAALAPAKTPLTDAQREARRQEALRATIQELVSSFEYAPSVERALDLSRAKFLARLDAGKDASPEALKRFLDAKAALADLKFDLVPMKQAIDIVRRTFNMREEIYLAVSARDANLATLTAMVTGMGDLTADQAAKVAASFKAAYESEFNRLAQQTLKNYAMRRKEVYATKGDRFSRSERFLRLSRLGGLRQEEFYNAMATEFDLPSYDPAIAEELDLEAARVDAMPVGSVQRNDAMRDLNSRIVGEVWRSLMAAYGPSAVVKDRGMLLEYVAGVPVGMWKAGVLSGIGTSEVNLLYGWLQSGKDLMFNSVAYGLKAGDAALVARNLGTVLKTSTILFDQAAREETWLEMQRAWKEGRTRFASEQSENMLVLERDIPPIGLPVIRSLMSNAKKFYRTLGRIMGVVDSIVSVPAAIARQRLAMEYVLTLSKTDRDVAEQVMAKSFTPAEVDMREINAVLASEEGQFARSPRPDLLRESRRRQLMEQRRAELYAEIAEGIPEDAREDYLDESRKSARFASLANRPVGLAGLLFDGIFGEMDRKSRGLTSWLIAFPRAMGNLLDFSLAMSFPFGAVSFLRAYNNSPSSKLLPAKSRYRRDWVEPGSVEFHKLRVQGYFALAVQMTLATFFKAGMEDENEDRVPWFMVYGKGYADPDKNQQLLYRQPRWAPYTVKIGDTYLNWKDVPGFNLFFAGMASLSDMAMNSREKDMSKVRTSDLVLNSAIGFVKAVTVKSTMAGIGKVADLASENKLAEAAQVRNFTNLVTGTVAGATNPMLLRDAVNIGRGLVGGGEYTLQSNRGLTAALASVLPGNAAYSDKLGVQDMVNDLGRPVTNFWNAPLTKRILPVTASEGYDPIITPLASAGLFLDSVDPGKMTFTTYADRDSSELDTKGGPLSAFSPTVEREAVVQFGEEIDRVMTPELLKDLTDQASQGKDGLRQAQKRLNNICSGAKQRVSAAIQQRIIDREIYPHWQE